MSPWTLIQAAGWMNTSPSRPGNSQTLPSRFQGKPVATNWRARSASTQAPASARARGQPGRAKRAAQAAAAMNNARVAARAGTAMRDEPPEARRLDQDGFGDPVETDQVEAKAEPPAAARRHHRPRRRIDQGQQCGEGHQQDRQGIERRQGQRGKRAQSEGGMSARMPRRVATRAKKRAGRPERLRDRRLERPRGSRQRPKHPLPLRRGDAGRASAPPLIIERCVPSPQPPPSRGGGVVCRHLRPASPIAAYPRRR